MLSTLYRLTRIPNLYLLATFLVLLLAAPLFFIGGPTVTSGPLFTAVWDLGHILFFAVLLLFVQQLLLIRSERLLAGWDTWLALTLIVFLSSCIIEYVQTKVGRDGNWFDILKNLTGTWLGLFWFQKPRPLVWAGRILACLLLIPPMLIVARLALVQYQASQEFPLLSGFEQDRDVLRWVGNIESSTDYATQGTQSLKVTLDQQKLSEVAFKYYLGEWQNYERLAFDIFNPDDLPLTMTVRIHDVQHEYSDNNYSDRFNKKIGVNPGWNYYQFSMASIKNAPAQRQMDLQKIHSLKIFTAHLQQSRTVYLDNVRLER